MKKASLVILLLASVGLVVSLLSRKGEDKKISAESAQDQLESVKPSLLKEPDQVGTSLSQTPSPQLASGQGSSAPEAEENLDRTAVRKSKSSSQIKQNFLTILPEHGFTQHEIDTAVDIIAAEFERSDKVDVIQAVERASKQLELNPERKNALNKAVLKSLSTTISYQQVEACVQHRIKNEDQCVKDIAQDMLQSVVSRLESNELDVKILQSLQDVQKNAVSRSIKDCNVANEKAESLFDLYLTNCP